MIGVYGEMLESEVLKLGHHGSHTSSAKEFLAAVEPEFAVVSAGADNRYGHPDPAVVARVRKAGARVVNTAEMGTIIFQTDGKKVWLKDKK